MNVHGLNTTWVRYLTLIKKSIEYIRWVVVVKMVVVDNWHLGIIGVGGGNPKSASLWSATLGMMKDFGAGRDEILIHPKIDFIVACARS
jgi:hypothetical protein